MQSELSRRPLVVGFALLCAGVSTAFSPWFFACLLALLLVVPFWRVVTFGLAAFLVGVVLRPTWPVDLVQARSPFSETVVVVTVPRQSGVGTTCLCRGRATYRLNLPDGDYSIGDRIKVSGEIGPLSEGPGISHGAVGVVRAERADVVERGPQIARGGQSVSASFLASIRRNLGESSYAFVAAVCFNETSGLEDGDWEMFRRTGITHIVSASGFHVVVAAALVLFVVGLLPLPRSVQLAIVVLFLTVYAFGAGFRPPVVRSVVMAGVGSFAYFFRREADGLSALSLAGLLNVLADPLVVSDTGFHLSLAAVGGLVMFAPAPARAGGVWESAKFAVQGSWVAIVSTLPIVGHVFGQVSLISLPMNLAIAPLVGLLVWVSLAGWLVGLAIPPLGDWIQTTFVEPLAGGCLQLAQAGGDLEFAVLELPWYPLWAVWVSYGLMVLVWRPKRRDP